MVNTTFYRNGQVIENRAQRVTGNVGQALVARSSAILRCWRSRTRTTVRQRCGRSPQNLNGDSLAIWSADPNFEQLEADLRDAALKRSDQISAILTDRITARDRIWITERSKWIDLFVSPPVDHSFWWAQTQPHLAPDTRPEFRDDGLHFWGGPKVNTDDGKCTQASASGLLRTATGAIPQVPERHIPF